MSDFNPYSLVPVLPQASTESRGWYPQVRKHLGVGLVRFAHHVHGACARHHSEGVCDA